MSSVEGRADSELTPDWNRHEATRVDRVNWEQIIEFAKSREHTPGAPQTEEA